MIEENKMLLEIIINPIPQKRIELSQTFEALLENLKKLCSSLKIQETKDTITLTIEMKNEEQLEKSLNSYEFRILKGAINILSSKTEILINGIKSNSKVLNAT